MQRRKGHSLSIWNVSITRDRWVHFGGPGENSAAQIANLAETGFAEKIHGLRGALSAAAVRDDFARRIQFVDAARQFPQGNQVAPEIADLIFVGLTHIQNEQVVPLIESLFQFAGRDFRNLKVAFQLLFAADSAKLVVVDELVNLAMAATHRTMGVLAKFQLAELQGQRIEEHEAASERIAAAENQFDCFESLKRPHNAGKHA